MSRRRHTEAQIISCAEAGGGRSHGRGCGPGTGLQQAKDLCPEGEVRRHGGERGRRGQASARGERPVEKLVVNLSLDKDMLQSDPK